LGYEVPPPGSTPGAPTPEELIAKGSVGSLLFITDPAVINRMQHMAVDKSPHHIPLIFGFDVIHGFRTIFPVPIAMAASWDPEVVMRAQTIAAAEARAAGVDRVFAPMVDIARDPRWGRIAEGAGEDPYLGAAIAAAQVRGFQGHHIGAPDHVLACAKHFAGYGAAIGGRDYEESYISDSQMWNTYLPPFHAAVQAGVGSIMSAYMDLNDVTPPAIAGCSKTFSASNGGLKVWSSVMPMQ
jgi:beta-glucosidase